MHKGAAANLTFFENKSDSFKSAVIPFLVPNLLAQGNYLFEKNDYADDIYFIVNGRINLLFGKQDNVFRTISAGLYIGDIEVVKQCNRINKALAIEQC